LRLDSLIPYTSVLAMQQLGKAFIAGGASDQNVANVFVWKQKKHKTGSRQHWWHCV